MGSLRGNKENWNWAAKKFWSGAWVQNKKIPAGSLVGKKKRKNQVEIPDAKILVEGWGEKKKIQLEIWEQKIQ